LNQFSRSAALWIFLFIMVALIYNVFGKHEKATKELSYSKFRDAIEQGQIEHVAIKPDEIVGKFKEGFGEGGNREFVSYPPPEDQSLVDALRAAKVEFEGRPKEEESWYLLLLANWFPFFLLIAVWIFFMRQIQVGGGKALSFGKSRARLMEEGAQRVTFEDVAGIEESKAELDAVVQFLKDPKKFTKLGGRIPKGVLLVGGPGTGKTLLARAIAGEAGVPFFSISGSDFVEMFVGVGASRVRDLFMRGKKNAPCIIFIDEIDAVGRHRGAGLGGGHDEREQTLNQLLVEMDGFEANEGVILIAATNRPDVLDPALLRPGRFDRTVVVPLPDIRGRAGVIKVHTKKVPLDDDVSVETIARGTPGFSGADLANLVTEAALYAARQGGEKVAMAHFEYAKDKILMGTERRSMVLSQREKQISAYHEAGHALIAKLIPNADPVHKVTIVPRGVALGLMQQLPEDEKHTYPKQYWLDRICIAFGGRAAEEIVFNEITTGASSDINAATDIGRKMVCDWGMSEALGPLSYGRRDDAVFLGRELGHQRDYSEQTADRIDSEVRSIVESQLHRARKLLSENREKLDALAQVLLKEETLDSKQVDEVLQTGQLIKDNLEKNEVNEEGQVSAA
jgi:cell division protease FtsH